MMLGGDSYCSKKKVVVEEVVVAVVVACTLVEVVEVVGVNKALTRSELPL